MKCLLVEKNAAGELRRAITDVPQEQLPEGDVLIRVQYSSLNYKDAMAAEGNGGVVRTFPHIPGIDAVGVVEESSAANFAVGDQVLVTGYELGSGRWGGWSQYVRVPAEWVVPLPSGLSAVDAMTVGTAGFTAAQCVDSLQHHGVKPDGQPVVVTGATGGVGSLAVKLLSQLGYQVVAVSGKTDKHDWLRELGASEIIGREEVDDDSGKPLLRSRWGGAVDTVGGNTLATLLRSLAHRGSVAACGLVGGTDLPLTVFPFLLRGVTLDGIDSAQCPRADRERMWELLSGDWRLKDLESIRTIVPIEEIEPQIKTILAGGMTGRVVVEIDS